MNNINLSGTYQEDTEICKGFYNQNVCLVIYVDKLLSPICTEWKLLYLYLFFFYSSFSYLHILKELCRWYKQFHCHLNISLRWTPLFKKDLVLVFAMSIHTLTHICALWVILILSSRTACMTHNSFHSTTIWKLLPSHKPTNHLNPLNLVTSTTSAFFLLYIKNP